MCANARRVLELCQAAGLEVTTGAELEHDDGAVHEHAPVDGAWILPEEV